MADNMHWAARRYTLLLVMTATVFNGCRLALAQPTDEAPRDAYVQRLVEALVHDEAYKVRLQAAVLLGRSKDLRAVEPLLAALAGDAHYTVRAAAATALGVLGDSRAIAHLLQRIALDGESFVREEASAALGKFPRERALPYVMAAFGSEDPAVRKQVLRLLTEQVGPSMEPVLVSALGDTPEIFTLAANAIMHLGPGDEALHILEDASRHRDPAVRRGAVQVLQRLGTAEATRVILEVYDRDIEVDEVREATRVALRELRRYLPIQQFLAEATAADKHVRARALKLLGVLGGPAAGDALVAALHADDTYIRGTAVLALGDLGDPRMIPALEQIAADPSNQRILHLVRHTLKQLKEAHEHAAN